MPLELKDRTIDLLKPKCNQVLQLTFDESLNVPDIKPDLDRILQSSGQITILEEEILENKVKIKGELKTNVLYAPLNDKKPIHNIDVTVPFEEIVNVDGVTTKDTIQADCTIEDLGIEAINSRKIGIQSLAQLRIDINEKKEIYVTTDVISASEIQKKVEPIRFCQLKASTKENYKIKDELAIPAGKPNIMEILWHDVSIQNKDIKLLDGKVNVKGTLHLATLYIAEDTDNSLEFVEHDLSFNGLIDCYDCREDMVHDITIKISEENISPRPDLDGEERVFSVEVDTKIDIKVYSEEQANILSDLYSLEKSVEVQKEDVNYQTLLCKNQSQCTIKETIAIDEHEPEILQIYYTTGDVVIDDIEYSDDRIDVEGVLLCKTMYVAANDSVPVNVFEAPLPFEHSIDVKDLKESSIANITPNVNYINCTMVGEKEVEIKCAVNMNTIVFDEKHIEVISEVEELPIDINEISKVPGIIGYVVKDKDTLWDIAKKFKTKIENIVEMNELEEVKIKRGDKLIIVKELNL